MRYLAYLLMLIFPVLAWGARLEYAGVLGNSGIAGSTLVRINATLRAQDGSGQNSGVYLDRQLRVWTSGGDAINCLAFDGRLVRRYPLNPPGSRIDTPAFAVLDGVLYTLGHGPKPREEMVLFALPLEGATEATVVLPQFPTWRGALCPTPWDGKLLLAYSADDKTINIDTFDPHIRERKTLLTVPGNYCAALALAPDGQGLIVGGYFGKYVGANIHQPNVHEIVKLAWDGTVRWRKECLETPANPTQFRGVVSVAGDALWDAAWYGFFARFDLDGKAVPGKVLSWDMRVPYISQVLDARQGIPLLPPSGVADTLDPMLLATHEPEQVYLAMWDADAQEVKLQQRYGALPKLGNIYLSPEGWVFADSLWWRFDDAANAAPRFANHVSTANTPGAFHGDWVCALRQDAQPAIPCVARPALGRESAQYSWGQRAPFKQPQGFAVGNADAPVVWAYATVTGTNQIWRTRMDLREWVPVAAGWKTLTIEGEAPVNPGDIAVLSESELLVADAGALVWLQQVGDVWRVKTRLSAWGDAPEQHFGAHLRLAADGRHILVSDTDRHRVVLIDARTGQPCWRYGLTDKAGESEEQFNAPGAVAIAGNRAIVADIGNQRIIKFTLREVVPPRVQAWSARKPVIKAGKIVEWASAPEFLAWRDADPQRDGTTGKVLRVKLTGPFTDGAWSQHAGVLLVLADPLPANMPYTITFKARSLAGSKNLTVYRSWGGSTPWETIALTNDWRDYTVTRVADHSTELITFSLVAKTGGLQPYCAGECELADVRVAYSP